MKTISAFLLFCLSAQAVAAPIDELESRLNEYAYAMTVEWDQKDSRFQREKTDAFLNQIAGLVLEKGLTREDVVRLVEKKAPTKRIADEMKNRLARAGSTTPDTLAKVLQETYPDFLVRGASWDAQTWETIGIVVGISALVTYAIWFWVNYDCVAYDYRRQTGCDSANCYERYCSEYVRR